MKYVLIVLESTEIMAVKVIFYEISCVSYNLVPHLS